MGMGSWPWLSQPDRYPPIIGRSYTTHAGVPIGPKLPHGLQVCCVAQLQGS